MEPTLQLELIEGWIMLYQKQNYDRFADSNNAVIYQICHFDGKTLIFWTKYTLM